MCLAVTVSVADSKAAPPRVPESAPADEGLMLALTVLADVDSKPRVLRPALSVFRQSLTAANELKDQKLAPSLIRGLGGAVRGILSRSYYESECGELSLERDVLSTLHSVIDFIICQLRVLFSIPVVACVSADSSDAGGGEPMPVPVTLHRQPSIAAAAESGIAPAYDLSAAAALASTLDALFYYCPPQPNPVAGDEKSGPGAVASQPQPQPQPHPQPQPQPQPNHKFYSSHGQYAPPVGDGDPVIAEWRKTVQDGEWCWYWMDTPGLYQYAHISYSHNRGKTVSIGSRAAKAHVEGFNPARALPITVDPLHEWRAGLKAGSKIDARDSAGRFYHACVDDVSGSGGDRVLTVRFAGYHPMWNEEIDFRSDRLAPYGRYALGGNETERVIISASEVDDLMDTADSFATFRVSAVPSVC